MNNLGQYLRSHRQDPRNFRDGSPLSASDVADALRGMGVPIERRTYNHIEQGRTQRPRAEVINALPRVLPTVTVLAMVREMGYDVAFEGIESEEEVELLEAYREASEAQHLAVRGALLLPVRQPPAQSGTSLRRLVETARRDRQGTRE